MTRTFTTAVASIAAGKGIVMLITAVSTPIIVRLLGAGGYGQYATVMAVFGLLMILLSSGITSGVKKYIAEERSDPDWKSHVFGYYFRLAGVLALLGGVAVVVAVESGAIARALGPHYVPYFYLIAGFTIVAQFRGYVRRTLMGLKLEHFAEAIHVLRTVLFAASAIAFVYLGYGVAGVLFGHVLAGVVTIALCLALIARQIPLRGVFAPLPESFPRRDLRNFNTLSIVFIFLLTSLYHVDVLMLEYFTDSARVGYYKAALVLVEFLWFVPKSIQAVMIQSTADIWEKGDVDRINRMTTRVTRYVLLATLLMALGLAALAADFAPLYYGPEFAASVLPLLLLIPGTIGFAVARPVLAVTHAKGEMRVLIYGTGASALLNLLLNLLLIPAYGMVGAAVATSIGYGSLPVFQIWGAYAIGYRPFADLRPVRIAATTVAAGAGILGLATVIESSILSLLVVPPVGFCLFVVIAVAVGAVDVDEIVGILEALPAPFDRTASYFERTFA